MAERWAQSSLHEFHESFSDGGLGSFFGGGGSTPSSPLVSPPVTTPKSVEDILGPFEDDAGELLPPKRTPSLAATRAADRWAPSSFHESFSHEFSSKFGSFFGNSQGSTTEIHRIDEMSQSVGSFGGDSVTDTPPKPPKRTLLPPRRPNRGTEPPIQRVFGKDVEETGQRVSNFIRGAGFHRDISVPNVEEEEDNDINEELDDDVKPPPADALPFAPEPHDTNAKVMMAPYYRKRSDVSSISGEEDEDPLSIPSLEKR